MTESEPWSYHPDGSPVLSLADIIRKRAAVTPARVALAEPSPLTSFADARCYTLITDLDYLAWRDARSPHDPGELAGPDETALISWTSDRLAHFKCPVGVTFAPSLARTASGKL